LRIEEVNGDGDGFTQMATDVLNHFTRQRVAFIGGFTDIFDRAVIQGYAALVALFQQMAYALFNGGIGGDGFQTAKVTAMTSLAERFHLDVANFTHITVAADKNAPVRDDSCPGSAMNAHQNGVLTVLTCPKVVLSESQTADIVTDETG
jgi:hypothetical protein